MGSILITGNGGVAIGPDGMQISLPDTDVTFKYDTATHTITLEGAEVLGSDAVALRLRQAKGLRQELVLLNPIYK